MINITDADGDNTNGAQAQQVVAVDIGSDGFAPTGDLYISFADNTFASVSEVLASFEVVT